MILIIVTLAVVAIFITLAVKVKRSEDLWPLIIGTLFSIAIGFAVITITAVIDSKSRSDTLLGSNNLVALNTSSSTTGSFFLGSGSIEDVPALRWLQVNDNGAVVLKQIEARYVLVYENANEETPAVERWGGCPSWVTIPFDWGKNLDMCFTNTYLFRIPEGSILNEYNVNP